MRVAGWVECSVVAASEHFHENVLKLDVLEGSKWLLPVWSCRKFCCWLLAWFTELFVQGHFSGLRVGVCGWRCVGSGVGYW